MGLMWPIPNKWKWMDRHKNWWTPKMFHYSCTFWELSPDKLLYLQSGSWEPPCDSQRPIVGKGRSWRTPHADLLGKSDSGLCGCTVGSLWCGSFLESCSPQRSGPLCSCSCLERKNRTADQLITFSGLSYQKTNKLNWSCGYFLVILNIGSLTSSQFMTSWWWYTSLSMLANVM